MDIDDLIDGLIEREGGYTSHPADRGGSTKFGITEATARANGYRGAMRDLPRDEAAAIYRRLYWLRPKFDQVARRSPAIAAELFDTGANMGRRLLQPSSSGRCRRSIATARIIPISFPTDVSGRRRLLRSTDSWNFGGEGRAKPCCCVRSMPSRASAISVSPSAAQPMRRSFTAGPQTGLVNHESHEADEVEASPFSFIAG
jgi:hypothetical protein